MEFQPYDVVQISNDKGQSWMDFGTLRDTDDFYWATLIIQNRHPQFSGKNHLYRVTRRGKVIAEQN